MTRLVMMRQSKMGDELMRWRSLSITILLCALYPVAVLCADSNLVNVALEKPIQVIPPSATCGFGDSNEFIINTEFEFSTLAHLFRNNHVMKCARDCVRKYPRDINYLKVTEPGQVLSFGEPACNSAAAADEDTVGCYVNKTYPQSEINTYSLWLWPNATTDGVILNATNFQLRYTPRYGGSVSFVQQHSSSSAGTSWPAPLRAWSHIAVQEDVRLLSGGVLNYSILINGSVHPVVISYTTSSRTSTVTYTSISVGHPDSASSFSGQLRDVRHYEVILTNREIEELYSGSLPPARPMSQCLCDQMHPNFDPHTSQMHCLSNSIGSSDFMPRIFTGATSDNQAKYVFVPELINDGLSQYHYGIPLMWVSTPRSNRESDRVKIQIDFEIKAEVEVVEMQMVSPPPEGGYEYERYVSGRWLLWHVLAHDCLALGYVHIADTDFYMKKPEDPWCQQLEGFYNTSWVDDLGLGVKNPPVLRWEVTSERPGKLSNWEHEDLQNFKIAEGLRVVFKGAPRGTWPDRRQGVHAIVEINVKGREMPVGSGSISHCDCYEHGTDASRECDVTSGQCPCRPGEGDPQISGKQCVSNDTGGCSLLGSQKIAPYIQRMTPSVGPIAGGTRVHLEGGFLGDNGPASPVKMGSSDCVIKISNATDIWCTTSALPEEKAAMMNVPLPVGITLTAGRDEYFFYANSSFQYRPNPAIGRITPTKSFIRGGINLTVSGSHLDSVASPQMQVRTLYQNSNPVRDGPVCFIESGSLMRCPTPHVTLPPAFQDLDFIVDPTYQITENNRRKRAVDTDLEVVNDGINPSAGRLRREISALVAADAGLVNKEDLNFEIHFKMDWVENYQSSPTKLNIYTNPLLHNFTDVPYIYNPFKKDVIVIKGRSLDYGCQKEDYIVKIGSSYCIPKNLTDSELLCTPPSEQPETNDSQALNLGAVHVDVKIGNIEMRVGMVLYKASLWDNPAFRIPMTIFIILLILVPLLIILYLLWRRYGDDSFCPWKEYAFPKSDSNSAPVAEAVPLHTFRTGNYVIFDELADDVKDKITDCIIAKERVETLKEVGKGHFGRVYAGILKPAAGQDGPKLVAVKTLREEAMQLGAISDFLREATIMKDFDHVNILRLIGVVLEDGFVYVILPYMENGDLRTFIARPEIMFTVRELLGFGQQAGRGLAYLENQKFIHRDVAARNCMVDNDRVVKIADFGLARDIYEKDYYRPEDVGHPLPVKWTSPECLDGAEFTSKSDVWSYGVLVWEILTRGKKPYNDVSNFEMKHYLRTGRRLDQPEYCPDNVYELMLQCWNMDPYKRPCFQDIVDRLDVILNPLPPAPPPPGGEENGCCGEDPLDVMYAPCRSSTSSTRYSPMPTSDC